MKTISIRDLRQRWPEAEAALETEHEILITRDSKPVAKLVRLPQPSPKRPRWSVAEHRKWIKKVFGNKNFSDSEKLLEADRSDRNFI